MIKSKIRPVTIDVIMHLFPEPNSRRNVKRYYEKVSKALADFKITKPELQLVAFATIRAESAGFRPITEGLSKYNTDPTIVGKKGTDNYNLYEFRKKLGNTTYGDGKKYAGRGFVQLTGKANYDIHGAKIGNHQLLADPEQANDPDTAARLLASFIQSNKSVIERSILNFDFYTARRAVNGGSNGLDEFRKAYILGYLRLGGILNNEVIPRNILPDRIMAA